ncbi:hypothetical protein AARAC_009809 [Aspergillus arachidicola]|uniref:HAD-like domain-containing protein n=1 Tax=Aspergillus arachidicola TaxID=656916 RepID=A0A2G7G3J2_9EURO|nr:hypothetical protein AARAC_009809 [Aspergillus arachidicola]
MPTTLAIFDFDGTLFDTHESISQTIKLTFAPSSPPTLLPNPKSTVSSPAAPASPTPSAPSTPTPQHSQPKKTNGSTNTAPSTPHTANSLSKPSPAHSVPIAIVSNKGVAAVKTALERNGLAGYVPEELIIGDKTPGAQRKRIRRVLWMCLSPS